MVRKIIPKPVASMTPTPPKPMPPTSTTNPPKPTSTPTIKVPTSSINQAKIDRRHEDIQQMTADYIMELMNEKSVSFEELGYSEKDLDDIIDEFEAILYAHSILIYHPSLFEDELTGETYVVDSIYE